MTSKLKLTSKRGQKGPKGYCEVPTYPTISYEIVFNLSNNQGEVITKSISKGHNSRNQNEIICNFCPKELIEVCIQLKQFFPV